jgi:hypothetical protein
MSARGVVEWVDAQDRLPDDDICVLIAMADGEVWTGFYDPDGWHYVSADPVGSEVTHWSHFPEPPKK